MSTVDNVLSSRITGFKQRRPRLFYGGIVAAVCMVFLLAQPLPLPGDLKLLDYEKQAPIVSTPLDLQEITSNAKRPAFGPGATLESSVNRAEALWAKNVKKRQNYIKEKNKGTWEGFKMFTTKGGREYLRYAMWDIFVPAFPCPWEVERIGVMADGGKITCGLPRVQETKGKKCVIYSFGVERESSFEAEVLETTDCEIWMYDFSVQTFGPQLEAMNETMQSRAHFFSYGLGGTDFVDDKQNHFYTLQSLMKRNGHDWIDILKIDVEGAEFQIMPTIIKDFGNGNLPFSQLLLEIHADKTEHAYHTPEFAAWWEQMEAAGLRAFANELNYPAIFWNPYPTAIEYSFLNNCLGKKDCGTLLR